MARIVLKKSGTLISVQVSGEATLQNAAKAKDYFMSIANGEYSLCRIDLSDLTGIDLPFLELLLSFRKTMISKNKKIEFDMLHADHFFMQFLSRSGIRNDSLGLGG